MNTGNILEIPETIIIDNHSDHRNDKKTRVSIVLSLEYNI